MTCGRCNTYFCWICGIRLNPQLPYLHYQNPESKCFNKLYHGLIVDEEEGPDADYLEDDDLDEDDDDFDDVLDQYYDDVLNQYYDDVYNFNDQRLQIFLRNVDF